MALIKARSKKESKKEIILADNIWADIDAYCKYAGIGGTIGAKRSVFIEEAAKLVFSQDEGFEEFKRQAKTQKKVKKDTPSAPADIKDEQQKEEEIKKEKTPTTNSNRK